MVKRKGLPWAPNCVPDMRRQWCNALDTLVARQSTALQDEPAEATAGGARRLQRLQAKLAESLAQMRTEAEAIRGAELYWVSRDMVDVALDAADSLPECYVTVPRPGQLLSVVTSVGSG